MSKEVSKEEVEEMLTPRIDEPDELVKEVKVQDTGRQLIIQIPAQVAEALRITKGDAIIFRVPLKNVKSYSIKLKKFK